MNRNGSRQPIPDPVPDTTRRATAMDISFGWHVVLQDVTPSGFVKQACVLCDCGVSQERAASIAAALNAFPFDQLMQVAEQVRVDREAAKQKLIKELRG